MEMQIERAAWPDNGCGVDSTSLHACLNAEAMRYVLDLVPEPHRKDVTFSNTFHWPHKSLFEAATPDKFERDYGDQCGGFYIHIPNIVVDKVLSMLRFMGHKMVRGCWDKDTCECDYCKHVETKRYREWKESE